MPGLNSFSNRPLGPGAGVKSVAIVTLDRAPIESLFGTLKTELVHHRAYRTREEAKSDIFFYIEVFYNRRRRHSALGYLSPVDFELVHQEESMLTYCPQN